MVAITENTVRDNLRITADYKNKINEKKMERLDFDRNLLERSMRTLDAIKARTWKENWPLVTEVELNATGP